MVSMGRRNFGTDFQVMFRILKALLFLGFLSVMTILFVVCGLTISDLFSSILAFLPTGWAILLVSPHTFLACPQESFFDGNKFVNVVSSML